MTHWIVCTLLFAQAAPTAPEVDDVPPPAAEQQVAPENPAPTDQSEPADNAETEPAEESASDGVLGGLMNSGALKLLLDGGWFMLPILLLGIVAFGVIIERYRSLKMLSTDSSQLRNKVRALLEQDQPEKALELCDRETGPVAAILAAGLRKYVVLRRLGYDTARIEEQVIKAMDDYSVHIVAALEKHLPILATVSSAAPMLGFLGTVSGMIVSFNEINERIGEENIVKLASGGISEALLTTCAGLIIGIPAFIGFNYFNSVINRFVLDVEESATELIETVSLNETLADRNGAITEKSETDLVT
ncbi:MotA/TolQ/ExbB proton channel family protein [Thalassoroseus pseudoceratinae]|uniref:MotA/TolQ/ExbB proton channel family protein n=1 Tax=Thalassoroseus pseudoceratinae TaxID=2713176 RepID=UPI001981644C|nr:MotA/TolQ/ExbB proton channel family protein [Thalassoroseus pseudoceratinae]